MAKLQTREICIPFAGFYHSNYSGDVDSHEEQFIEHHCDESDGDESQWPEELRLDNRAYSDALVDATSYRDAYEAIARDYVATFSELAGEALGISARESVRFWSWADKAYKRERREVASLRLKWSLMTSPREYNFQTDRLFAHMPVSVIRKLWAISKAEKHETLTRVARERFTSRSGFISFYESAWSTWGNVLDWDHNQLQTLLIAACEIEGFDWQDRDLTLYYPVSESTYQAWESAVDWQKLDSTLLEARAEKLAEWMTSDPVAALAWVAKDDRSSDLLAVDELAFPDVDESTLDIPYRCKLTPDMFPETLEGEA